MSIKPCVVESESMLVASSSASSSSLEVALHFLSAYIREAESCAARQQRLASITSELQRRSEQQLSLDSMPLDLASAVGSKRSFSCSSSRRSIDSLPSLAEQGSADLSERGEMLLANERTPSTKRRRLSLSAIPDGLASAATTAAVSSSSSSSFDSLSSVSSPGNGGIFGSRVFEDSFYLGLEQFIGELPSFRSFSRAANTPFFESVRSRFIRPCLSENNSEFASLLERWLARARLVCVDIPDAKLQQQPFSPANPCALCSTHSCAPVMFVVDCGSASRTKHYLCARCSVRVHTVRQFYESLMEYHRGYILEAMVPSAIQQLEAQLVRITTVASWENASL